MEKIQHDARAAIWNTACAKVSRRLDKEKGGGRKPEMAFEILTWRELRYTDNTCACRNPIFYLATCFLSFAFLTMPQEIRPLNGKLFKKEKVKMMIRNAAVLCILLTVQKLTHDLAGR